MKTDRNKNNVKSEENMILEKSRRSDANVFPVENKGKGKIAKAKKRQVKGVIWKTVLQQKWLSMGIVFAVAGAVVTALIPPLILAKIVDTVTAGKAVTFWVSFPLFCNACTYRIHGICQGRSAYRIWAENHTCT